MLSNNVFFNILWLIGWYDRSEKEEDMIKWMNVGIHWVDENKSIDYHDEIVRLFKMVPCIGSVDENYSS